MNTLCLMVGIPGSGKTTIAKNSSGYTHISRDAIRFSLLNENDKYFAREKEAFNTFVKLINEALNKGENVIADATHLNPKSRYKLLNRIHYNPNTTNVMAIFMNTPLEICLEHNETRKGGRTYVPPHDIYNMHENLIPPTYLEPFDYIYICDGTEMKLLERN